MTISRRVTAGWFMAIGLIALVGCWRQNLAFAAERGISIARAFVDFWPALLANRATTSIAIDFFLFGVAVMTWWVIEARRLGMRAVWIYVLLGFPIGISVTFAFFMAARERHLARSDAGPTRLAIGDAIALALIALPILAASLVSVVR